MPSFKLIGAFAAILLLGLSLLYAQRSGLAQGRAEGEARLKALVAQHSQEVERAQAEARADERAQAEKRAAHERELARQDEARVAARLTATQSTLRALREAAHADTDFARCQPVALPDGLRVEPAPAGPGGPTG